TRRFYRKNQGATGNSGTDTDFKVIPGQTPNSVARNRCLSPELSRIIPNYPELSENSVSVPGLSTMYCGDRCLSPELPIEIGVCPRITYFRRHIARVDLYRSAVRSRRSVIRGPGHPIRPEPDHCAIESDRGPEQGPIRGRLS